MRDALTGAWRQVRIILRAARILASGPGLPRLLRILFVIGLIQVPFLPFDELALGIALAWLFIGHRPALRAALESARAA